QAHDVLGLLIAELTLDAKPKWRTVWNGKGFAVQLVRKEGLRVESIEQIDTLIISLCLRSAERVRAMKHHVPGVRQHLSKFEDSAQGHSRPFSDRAPTFDAIMPGNLSARGHRTQ